ncbi:hypothetical protein ACFQ7N_10730 [Streptomyces niveus]|uniref:hypothetical protein n=1 Tax=Streptomyces niveus TaxID=193462 RepID=UPI003674F3AB
MSIDRKIETGPALGPPFALVLSRVRLPPAGRLLMLTMEPQTPEGESDDLAGLWPLWDDVLQRDPRWVVYLEATTRRIMRIVRLNDAQDAIEHDLFNMGAGIPVDPFWSLVEGQRPVVLCGPLRGEPTDENLHSAKRAGTLRGISARTLIS